MSREEERMASTLKRPRSQEGDEAAEDDHGLAKLLHRRLGDVEELVAHIRQKEDELTEARGKLDKAVTLLGQFRDRHGDRNQNPAPRREATTSNGVNGHTHSREDHHVRASHSPAKKPAAAASPSVHFTKTAGGSLASRPVSLGASPANRGQGKSSKRASVAKSNKGKGAVQGEHVDLIKLIKIQKKPAKLDVAFPIYVPLRHSRKPRSLVLSPAVDHLCATSALDGVVNFWQITREKGFGLDLSHSVDCMSPGQPKRWPENLAWHPHGKTLFAVYTADEGPQLGIIKTSKSKPGIKFLDYKPHEKGIINAIEFLPWSDGSQFVTGGCDHGVVLWTEKEEEWQPQLLHRTLHSSSVTGVGGIANNNCIISSGMDKRVIAMDPSLNKITFRQQLESKALGVAPNPVDCNLVMVQTGTPGQQLRLFDIRVARTELHSFGWTQLSGDAQSGYIKQSWSPDGLYCASGSTDPKIHVFDIRYKSKEPVQILDAHQKRVFKAAWHPNLPLLISISSDLSIGIHKIF